jgi:hypothetical protein
VLQKIMRVFALNYLFLHRFGGNFKKINKNYNGGGGVDRQRKCFREIFHEIDLEITSSRI